MKAHFGRGKFSTTLIGLFVTGAVALAVAATLLFGGGQLFAETEEYVMFFGGSVKGLNVGAPVRFRGVNIGAVTDVGLLGDPTDLSFRIPVRIAVERERIQVRRRGGEQEETWRRDLLGRLVERGLRAQLQLDSLLTGQLFVQLDFHPETPARYVAMPDSAVQELPTIPSKLEQFYETVEDIPLEEVLSRSLSVIEGIDRLVNTPALYGSLAELEQTLKEVRRTARVMAEETGAVGEELRRTLDRSRKTLVSVEDDVALSAEAVRRVADDARATLDRAERTLAELGGAISVDSPLGYQFSRTLAESAAAARELRILSESLAARPDLLLKGRGEGSTE